MIQTWQMASRSDAYDPNDWSTLRVFLDGAQVSNGQMRNLVTGTGNAVIGGDTTFTYHPEIGVYEPMPSTPDVNGDNLVSGSWPTLINSDQNALLALVVFRFKGESDGGASGKSYGKFTLRSTTDSSSKFALSNQGSWHVRFDHEYEGVADKTSAFPNTQIADALTKETDYVFVIKYRYNGAAQVHTANIELREGTSVVDLTGPDAQWDSPPLTGWTPTAGAYIQDMALYGAAIFEFDGDFPSDIATGIEWMRNAWVNGARDPYPGWKDL